MKRKLGITLMVWSALLQVHAQGYIVPNGVVTNLFPGEIDVWNPGTQITGFLFEPWDKLAPTTYTNVFRFDEPITIGVRVFLVSPNDPISLSPIALNAYPEFQLGGTYLLQQGVPFYVGLYTGANFAPPYPPSPPFFYLDPVFGWAKLVNNQGVIHVLDYAVAYKADGIYAGTQNLIQVPEPSSVCLVALGGLLLGFRRRSKAP